jgi:MFS transporter, PPP family, 3-phenylpropionic acid transporter
MKLNEANKLRILYFLIFCCTASWLPIFADYLKDKGLTGIESAFVISIPPLMMFLVQPLYGMIADKIGYKKCFLWSALLASVSYIFYLFGGGFVYLLSVTVFMSLFYNSLQPLLDSLSLKLAEEDKTFSYGSLRIAGAAGWSFMGIVAGHYIDVVNLTVIFIFSAASMFLAFLFAFSLANSLEDKQLEIVSFANVKDLLNNKTLMLLLTIVFLVSVGATTIWNYYSIYMKENGASASLVGFGISFQGLCELPLFYYSTRIIQRYGLQKTLWITVFATTIRLALYALVKNPYAAIPIELLHGISWSLFWVVCVEYVNTLVRTEWRATGQSLLYAAYFGIGAIVGNLWTGYLYDLKLTIANIFLLNAGIVSLVSILLYLLAKEVKKSANLNVS